MTRNRLIAITVLILILAWLIAYSFWQYQQQYRRVVNELQEYKLAIQQESAATDLWNTQLKKKKPNYAGVEKRARNLTFRLLNLRERVEDIKMDTRFTGLAQAKKKLLLAIDKNVSALNLLTTLSLEQPPGHLSKDESRRYLLAVAGASALEDRVIILLKRNKPIPDFYNTGAKLRRINDFLENYP